MKGFLITSVLLIAVKVNGFNLEDFLSQSSVKTVTDRMKDAGVKTPDDLKTWQTDLATLMNFDSIRGKAKIDGIVCKENTAGAPDCRKLKCAEQKACDAAWEAATKVPTETLAVRHCRQCPFLPFLLLLTLIFFLFLLFADLFPPCRQCSVTGPKNF
eukprot:GHVU01144551.1.p1 GENE.GHVU01144551.1~~GHVU01144551.1.p1  ORF type:complete len:157 (-),score=9.70 GHVU01144551.1:774-1244(-)